MKAQTIPPELYPQMLSSEESARLSQRLRSPSALLQSVRILEEAGASLREAVLDQVAAMEAAGSDPARIAEPAHEIKSFADMAGLPVAARIAEGLCRYLEQNAFAGLAPDPIVLDLHVRAIAQAARDAGLQARTGETVISELAALAAHKLAAARKSP